MFINKSEYHQLVGLRELYIRKQRELDEITQAALSITQEKDNDGQPEEMGHTWDMLTGHSTVEQCLRKMAIQFQL